MSSGNNLYSLLRPFDKSLTYIKNKKKAHGWNLAILQLEVEYQPKTNTDDLKLFFVFF